VLSDGKKGWKWGKNNKSCFESKQDAIKQAFAIDPQKAKKEFGSMSTVMYKEKPCKLYVTGKTDNHEHTYRQGDSVTSWNSAHSHKINSDGSIAESFGHTHEIEMEEEESESKVLAEESTINISVDAKNKKVSVSVNGETLENVTDIHVYTEESGYFGLEVVQREMVGDFHKVSRIMASDKGWNITNIDNTQNVLIQELSK